MIIIVVGYLIIQNLRSSSAPPQVKLTVWGIEDRRVFETVFQLYAQIRPNVQIAYQSIPESAYMGIVLNALAAGQGPDVLMVHNRSLPIVKNLLVPAYPAQMTVLQLRQYFPSVIEQDFVSGASSSIYAFPLYVDTLALFYNKDFFDAAGIVSPPPTWNDFQNLIPTLRELNPNGQIVRAAATIGGSEKTVTHAADLLELLMMQNLMARSGGNETVMTSPDFASARFASSESQAGQRAFDFYLQFANSASAVYTWNDDQMNSLDRFAGGHAAMTFGYRTDIARIKEKSPFLNFVVAAMPQVKDTPKFVNYPDYWGFGVSKQSAQPGWAWDFALFAATNVNAVKSYLKLSGHPPALNSIISESLNDPYLSVFARQALTARSWYEANENSIDGIMNDAISAVLNGRADSKAALRQAEDQVTQLMSKH